MERSNHREEAVGTEVESLQLLHLGDVDIDKGRVLTPGEDEGVWIRSPIWGGLVRTREMLVLFDTGIHPDHIADPDVGLRGTESANVLRFHMCNADRLEVRLAECGARPSDVAIVVNSHLHMDHCGQNGALPNATFLVQRDHRAFVEGNPKYPRRFWDIPGLHYQLLDGDHVIGPGLRVIVTSGHGVGHQSLVVDLPDTGQVVLTGDAAFLKENLRTRNIRALDPEAARHSLERILTLAGRDPDRCFVSHDPDAWAGWRHAPGAYT